MTLRVIRFMKTLEKLDLYKHGGITVMAYGRRIAKRFKNGYYKTTKNRRKKKREAN